MKIKWILLLLLLFGLCSVFTLYWYLPKVKVIKDVSEDQTGTTIGLIADTHVPNGAASVQQKVFNVFQTAKVDYIVHAGDITSQKVIERLQAIAPVIAVHGNHAPESMVERYPEVNSLSVAGYHIGVWHDQYYLHRKRRALELAHERNFDILIIGHSHKQRFLHTQGVYIINPGSSTNAFPPLLVNPTVAMLTIHTEPTVKFVDVSTSLFGGAGIWGELIAMGTIVFLLLLNGMLYRVFQRFDVTTSKQSFYKNS